MGYFLETCKYYAERYGIDKDDLINEAWLRITENERKINKKYIQLRIESVALDLRRSELRRQCLLERVRTVEYVENNQWAEMEAEEKRQQQGF